MFGDIGHGGLLFIFGIYLNVSKSVKNINELKGFYKLRYLLLLMGLFSFYCGWMYNDFFSLPMGICFT